MKNVLKLRKPTTFLLLLFVAFATVSCSKDDESVPETEAETEILNYTLTVKTTGEGVVTIAPEKAEYEEGETVTIRVEPAEGWYFKTWEGDIVTDSIPMTITMDQDKMVTAVFENPFAGGAGTEANPWQITTVEELQKINDADTATTYFADYFIQMNDIDASKTKDWNRGKGFKPLQLSGMYDGQGFVISDLTIKRKTEDNIGLFGYVQGAEISNVALVNVDIEGANFVGGLVGTLSSGGAGNAEVYDSSVTGIIYTTGSRNGRAGGLIGDNNGNVTNCHANVKVTSTGGTVGGLVGMNWGRIKQSYAEGDVAGEGDVGGLVGNNYGENAIINRSYAQGQVSGKDQIGGLVGASIGDGSTVYNCYATGKVIGTGSGSGEMGSLIGRLGNKSSAYKCYWNTETSGQTKGIYTIWSDAYTNNLVGLTTAEMQGAAAKTNMVFFDFVTIWKTVGNQYPALFWE